MNEKNKIGLIAGLERCLDDGLLKIDKITVTAYSHHDLETAKACLQQWASEGKLEILKPIDEAADNEPVIKMKSYIEGKSPWLNWPR